VIGMGRPKSSFERDAAIAAGHPRFFTGKPCKLGHVAERLTVNRQCVECARLLRRTETGRARAARAWRKAHPISGVWRSAERIDGASFTGTVPIIGVMAVRERADAALMRARPGRRTTERRKPIVGVMAAADFADNSVNPIKGRMTAVDPRDVAKFMRWRDDKR